MYLKELATKEKYYGSDNEALIPCLQDLASLYEMWGERI